MVRKQPGKITYRLGFTDDISMFLLALALSFLGAELWVYNIWAYVTPIVSLLAILTIITMYYTFKHQGIVKARVDILQKIQDERREYETWWVEEGPGRSQ